MSDHLPPRASSGDRLRDTLTDLRTDADRVGLSDPASVRRRGQARTRHQAVVGLAAAVIVVAVVVSWGALFNGGTTSTPPLPASPSPTAAARMLELAPDPFLRASDIPKIGVYDGFQRNPAGAVIGPALLECLSAPESLGAAELRQQRFFQDLDARFVEYVLRFADTSAADASVDQIRQDFANCHKGNPAAVTTTDRGPAPVEGVDGSLRGSRLSRPTAAAGVAYFEIAVVRTENVVVLLEWASMGNPENDDTAGWAWTAERLNLAAHRAIG